MYLRKARLAFRRAMLAESVMDWALIVTLLFLAVVVSITDPGNAAGGPAPPLPF